MITTIYYFTGTGNSLKIARDLCDILENCSLKPMVKYWKNDRIIEHSEKLGFVFPLHYFGLPKIVFEFVEKIELNKPDYIFAVVTKAGEWVGVPLIQLEKILNSKSKTLSAGFLVTMPRNYILDMDPHSEQEQKELFESAKNKVKNIAKTVEKNEKNLELDLTKKNRFEKVNINFHKNVNDSDKSFFIDDSCNSCGICQKVCPVNNIKLVEGKPEWKHQCLQCLACLNYCPESSIQFGDKTTGRIRYHHPEISVKDLINQKT